MTDPATQGIVHTAAGGSSKSEPQTVANSRETRAICTHKIHCEIGIYQSDTKIFKRTMHERIHGCTRRATRGPRSVNQLAKNMNVKYFEKTKSLQCSVLSVDAIVIRRIAKERHLKDFGGILCNFSISSKIAKVVWRCNNFMLKS